MLSTNFSNCNLEVEEYKEYAIDFIHYGDDLVFEEFIWVEDNYLGCALGWWMLGVGLKYPAWNINHKLEGVLL